MAAVAKRALTKAEAAEAYSISEKTIDRALKVTDASSGIPPLRCRRLGRSIRIDADELHDWFKSWQEG